MNTIDKRYEDSLDFLYSFIDFSMKKQPGDTKRFFKLDRMQRLADAVGNPERSYPVVHVAGTKGKGSTASLIARSLHAAGYKVGLYTSPHLVEFAERIQVDFVPIDQESLIALTDRLRPLTKVETEVSSFDLFTVLAFLYFQQQKVDIAVVEVGMGGRVDSTNIVHPLVSVITSISYDHMSVLGDTLTEIAHEKGGIIKPGVPVVLAPQVPEARKELLRLASERQSPVIKVEEAYSWQELHHSLDRQRLSIEALPQAPAKSLARPAIKLTLPLLGAHQLSNAVTALAALDVLRNAGFNLSRRDLQSGYRQTQWPLRFELLRKRPPIVLDSAHNGDSMLKLREALDEYFPGMPFIFLFGSSADKEMDAMLDAILPRVAHVIATQSLHPRAKEAHELAEIVGRHHASVEAILPAEAAIARALELAGTKKGILVSGSMFIASAVKEILRGEPPPK